MTYAIIGSGAIGSALIAHFASKGIPVKVANSRGPASLAAARKSGDTTIPVEIDEAVAQDIVILALPFTAVPDLAKVRKDWTGTIVIDATNAITFPEFRPADLGGRLSSEIVAETLPGAKVVKAFNTLPAAVLAANPAEASGRRVVLLSGNDEGANASVAGLIENLGFAALDVGGLKAAAPMQQFGGPLVAVNLIKKG
ncbi:NADPH-dependent F420 reductase [Hyphomicrobiales bacterium]|uniref:NADPH-dependent F420 reductase n=1 Tax=Ensifer sp. R-19 TaxID=3404055 RepID=UPI000DDF324F